MLYYFTSFSSFRKGSQTFYKVEKTVISNIWELESTNQQTTPWQFWINMEEKTTKNTLHLVTPSNPAPSPWPPASVLQSWAESQSSSPPRIAKWARFESDNQPEWIITESAQQKKKVIWRPVGDHCCGLKVVGCLFWVWDSEYGIQASLILSMLKQGKSFVVEAGQWQFFAGHALVCNRNNLT